MEFKELIKIFSKNLKLIIIITAIIVISALSFNFFLETKYKSTFNIIISQKGEDDTKDYKYDNYYSFRAIDEFSESFEKWFQDPEITIKTIEKSKINENINKIDPTKYFRARKIAPAYIEIKYKTKNQQEAKKIKENLVNELNLKLERIKEDKQTWYVIHTSGLYTKSSKINNLILSLISVLTGLIFGILTAILRHYFEK